MIVTSETNKKPLKHKKLIIVLVIILASIIALISTFFIMVKLGEIKLKNSLVANENVSEIGDNMDENAIHYNGKSYYYNEHLINILLIGTDNEKIADTGRGQADALYLASVDTKSNQVKIVSISRNTLCELNVLSMTGEAFGTENKQICLAYAYGNDDVSSSENCVKAVSKLLYDIPINGYYTIGFKSISKIVNSVGGVTLTIPDESPYQEFNDRLGKNVKLNGEEALLYLRMRGDSNAPRVERHKQFIKSFVNSAKTATKKDISLPIKMANQLSRDSTTNLDVSSIVYLATEALDWKLSFINIQGEYGIKDNLEIFTVDENKLKETVLDNFYIAK
ncbi:MAG: LCP family protein [Clostridia bacterium]|nr:LCP family protein [Clostridia bacterium]